MFNNKYDKDRKYFELYHVESGVKRSGLGLEKSETYTFGERRVEVKSSRKYLEERAKSVMCV